MAMTAAERQARFRHRHLRDHETVDSERINLVVTISTKRQLERLARRDGVTQRVMLETLLAKADRQAMHGMSEAELREYER